MGLAQNAILGFVIGGANCSKVIGPVPSSGGGGGAFTIVATAAVPVLASAAMDFPISALAQVGDYAIFAAHEGGAAQSTYNETAWGIGSPLAPTSGVAQQAFQASDNIYCFVTPITAGMPGTNFHVTSSRTGQKSGEIIIVRNTGMAPDVPPNIALSAVNGVNTVTPAMTTSSDGDFVFTFHCTATVISRTWSTPAGLTAGPTTDTGSATAGSASAMFYSLNVGLTGTYGPYTSTNAGGPNNVWGALIGSIKVGSAPPPATTKYGISAPGYPDVKPTGVIRTYNASQSSAIASGVSQCLSYKPSSTFQDNLQGLNGAPAQASAITTLTNYFTSNLTDTVTHYPTYYHEPDNDGIVPANYKAQWAVINANVVPAVNSGRTFPMRFGPIFVGSIVGSASFATIDTWVDPSCYYVGSDFYNSTTSFTNIANYCISRGFQSCVGEFGSQNGGPLNSDATSTSRVNTVVGLNNALSQKALFICWYDNDYNTITTNLSASVIAGATTITVDDLPQADGTHVGAINGATIIVDSLGANPETVVLTAGTNVLTTSGPPYSLSVPALAFPHAAGCWIRLLPNTCAALNAL